MSIVCILIGPPGSGKSTVGALVAQMLGADFADTDRLVEERADRSVSEIFIELGEAHFRELEAAAVEVALEGSGVVALGGGAVMNPATAELVRRLALPVVFLDVSITSAAPRIGFNRDRPLLVGNPRAQWLSLMQTRRATYEDLASYTVSTDERTPQAIAADIVGQIRGAA